jgi:molecular chaperone Hsp33
VLLAATLKLKGSLILQIQGRGPVTLLVVECDGELNVRATAKWQDDLNDLFRKYRFLNVSPVT